jgi:hypothetical protein
MQVYTITCHNVYNHGASLQEYALLQYLKNQGHQAQTINYTPDYLSGHFNLLSVDNPKWKNNLLTKVLYIFLKAPSKLLAYPRKKKFDLFSKRFIQETKKNYKTNKDLQKDLPNAEAYICGSDQIWNSFFQNGKDPAFYLNFVPDDKKKISYAASFAIDEIEDNLKEFVKENVQRLDAVSVRENSGKKILNNLNIQEVTQVLDPVFLLEKKEWDALIVEKIENNYILVYDFDSNPKIKEIALHLKNKYGWRIITLNKNIKYADKNYFLKGPQEFLSLVKNANFVFANSFHAVAFSIIFKKNFLVFNRMAKINTRMRDLLNLFNLDKRLVTSDCNTETIDLIIDYKAIDVPLNNQIQLSKEFLISSLDNK